MSISRIKTWAAAEVLTASDLNSEFNNILNNPSALWSPLAASVDFNGKEIILDADADSSLTADTDDRLDLKLLGVDVFRWNTVTSAVNGIDSFGAATGNNPYIAPFGSDSNVGLEIKDSNGNEIIIAESVASAVNQITETNAATGNNPSSAVTGGDTNIGRDYTIKGTGAHDFTNGPINANKGADIASATTTDIGAATGNFVDITGTTTITGLGTVKAGTRRTVQFDGALTLTHNATSLILPGNANITTAAGDTAEFISLGSGNWLCARYTVDLQSLGGSVLATEIATTSGTAHDFTGIPSYVKKITAIATVVSSSGTDGVQIQLGDSGGFETSGYINTISDGASVSVNTDAFGFTVGSIAAGDTTTGKIILDLADASNKWIATILSIDTGVPTVHHGAGSKTLSGTLTQIRFKQSGSDTFDAGTVNIMYE